MNKSRSTADVIFRFDEGRTEYLPGEWLRVEAVVQNAEELDCRLIEASISWRTVGQGDEDMEIVTFERIGPFDKQTVSLADPIVLEAELPDSPLSYNGINVKVCWCVRVRLFLGGYRETVAEAPFRLGSVWSPSVAQASA